VPTVNLPHANRPPVVRRRPRVARLLAAAAYAAAPALLLALGAGCEVSSFLDPTVTTDPKKQNQLQPDGSATPAVQVILDGIDLGEVAPDQSRFASARDVRAEDLEIITADYVIGPGDQLRISINDFPNAGQQFADAFEVTSTGFVNLPDIDEPLPVEGLTEGQVADAVEEAYVRAGILRAGVARANVLAFTKTNRTFTILGQAVGRPAQYLIGRPDFRMLDAVALAGVTTSVAAVDEYAYIIRPDALEPRPVQFNQPPRGNPNDGQLPPGEDDPLAPQGRLDTDDAAVFAQADQAGGFSQDSFDFEPPAEPTDRTVIRVPMKELLEGQLKFNVVIRPRDTVFIGANISGNYYVGGQAAVTGVFGIDPNNRVTLKRAIVAARGFNPVAIPQRTQLVRKVGDADFFVRVNLFNIMQGKDPDIYVEPDDMIMVGTNFPAPFLAALRNGFRVSYGFGFLYDRNFARDRQNQF
jgi:protein involved in polysaccharide export with SLBB domain